MMVVKYPGGSSLYTGYRPPTYVLIAGVDYPGPEGSARTLAAAEALALAAEWQTGPEALALREFSRVTSLYVALSGGSPYIGEVFPGERAGISYWRCPLPAGWRLHHALASASGERSAWDDGEVRCGDWLRPGARRLCGGCAQAVASDHDPETGLATAWEYARPEGCGDVLERRDAESSPAPA